VATDPRQTSTAADALAPVRYAVHLRSGTFTAASVHGSEALSTPSRFDVRFSVDDPDSFDPDALPGDVAYLGILRDGAYHRRLRLTVAQASIHAAGRGHGEAHLVLVPAFALLEHRRDVRAFVDRTVPEIVRDVLAEAGVPNAWRLRESYPRRPYVVEYNESDLAFVSRLLEDEGLFYSFAEDDDGTMLIADHASAYTSMGDAITVPYRAAAGLARERESVLAFGQRARLGPSEVTLRDFHVDRPSLDMDVHASGPTPAGLPHYDFPGGYSTPAEGERRARLLAEAFALDASLYEGRADVARIAPGRILTMMDAPALARSAAYVVTAVHHHHREGAPAVFPFEARPADLTYRPPRDTPTPVLRNPLTGVVVGPRGEDIHTDSMGRVKVRFPWDRRAPADDTASAWIPVLQDNTGHSVGIPRVGWEVVVHFVDGNPDRPVVLGRVYNGKDPFPDGLPDNKTVSSLRSVNSPGRNGANMIRVEDKAGSEQIYVQAERDQNIVIENDKDETIGRDERDTIGGEESVAIGRHLTVKVGKDDGLLVEKDDRVTIGKNRSRSVDGDDALSVGKDHALTIGAAHLRRIDGTDTVRARSVKETVGAVDLEVSLRKNDTGAGKALIVGVGGALIDIAGEKRSEKTTGLRVKTVGALLYAACGTEYVARAKTSRGVRIGGALKVSAAGKAAITAATELRAKALLGELIGHSSLTLNVGEHAVTFEAGQIRISTPGKIQILADAAGNLGAPKAQLNPGK
jgi:type VI secretion system secreted protein VgrG